MELIALTMDLSPSNFIGLGIGTKVSVISHEQFYKELNTPLFRGVYIKPSKKIPTLEDESFLLDADALQKSNFILTIGVNINVEILNKLVFIPQVFNWTTAYKALYYVEYADVPNSINPPAYMKIERLDNNLPIED